MKLVGVSVNNNSVAGIITAMKPYNVVGFPAKKSVTFPLPSSPHCAPTIAVILDRFGVTNQKLIDSLWYEEKTVQ